MLMLFGVIAVKGQDQQSNREDNPNAGQQAGPCQLMIAGAVPDEGEIVVGCPKIWRSERVFTMLDGLLRDVDSITVQALEGLDPNLANSSEITTIVNAFNASVKFDQTAAINNRFALEKAKGEREADLQNFEFAKENAKRDQDYKQTLYDRRDALSQKLNALQDQENDLRKAGSSTDDVRAQEDAVTKQLADIKTELSDANTSGQGGAATIPDKTAPASTSADQPPTDSLLSKLPDKLQQALADKLVAPSFPPAMAMDNTIELLHQRIARELAVMRDDLAQEEDGYNIYLAQFDISLNPEHGAKDRIARVEIEIKDGKALAYELYPSASAYNIMRGMDKTTHIGLAGAAQTIVGWGANASFSHDKEQLRSGLSQSMYVSGFGAGTSKFGWMFGPAPFENFVAPGVRTVHAIIAVPKSESKNMDQTNIDQPLVMKVSRCWSKQEKRYSIPLVDMLIPNCEVDRHPIFMRVRLPDSQQKSRLKITNFSYTPLQLTLPPAGTTAPAAATQPPITDTVNVQFKDPIDPNLTITVANHLLQRVRDFRGRGLYLANASQEKVAGTTTESDQLNKSRFGILESDQPLDPDTWYLMNSRTILLNIRKETAGTDTFPAIRLIDPVNGGGEITELLDDGSEVRVGEWHLPCCKEQRDKLPKSFFEPLFVEGNSPGSIQTFVEEATEPNSTSPRTSRIRINSRAFAPDGTHIWLHEGAQVVLDAEDGDEGHMWPLNCSQERGSLTCDLKALKDLPDVVSYSSKDTMKIWLDLPPYFGRKGFWADDDIHMRSTPREVFVKGDWTDVRALVCGAEDKCNKGEIWSKWRARIEVANIPKDSICVEEFSNLTSKAVKTAKATKNNRNSLLKQQLTGNTLKLIPGYEEYSRNNLTCPGSPVDVRQSEDNRYLELTIPFSQSRNISEDLHLVRFGTIDRIATLPDYRKALLPDNVTLEILDKDHFRVEGKRLEAVDQVTLVGADTHVYQIAATPGFESLDFGRKNRGTTVPPGKYSVQLGVHGLQIPAKMKRDDGTVAQVLLTIPEDKVQKPATKTVQQKKTTAAKQ